MSRLSVQNLTVRYAGRKSVVTALEDFSLDVRDGGFTILLGESGCGKSTALNTLAGLAKPDGGRIQLGDTVLVDATGSRVTALPPEKRDIGMVFQSYALWPHLTALDNVLYPLRRRGVPRDEAARRGADALAMVRCGKLGERYPGELSGGQQQRIALARALVANPKLLLFDEPLSNLDAGLRRSLRDELGRLHREIGFTGVYVTHDQSEALALGDQIAVMDQGRVVQTGTPEQIYRKPRTEFVARFFGANLVRGKAADGQVSTPIGTFASGGNQLSGPVLISFLPQDVTLDIAPDGPLTVAFVSYLGSHREIRLAYADGEVLATQPAEQPAPAVGDRVRARLDPATLQLFADG